ncbi:hypothetical protein V9N52_004321, partial [Vibrio navarrensis]
MNIHYDIQSIAVKAHNEPAHLAQQWQEVQTIAREKQLGELARARLAFHLVDYLTSEDLPLRLLITRAPQAMAALDNENKVHKTRCTIKGHPKNMSVVYSRSKLILPTYFEYTSHYLAQR